MTDVETANTRGGRRLIPFLIIMLCVAAFSWYEWIAISKFLIGRWYLADVGNINYALFNTMHGRFMFSPMTGTNHFAYHFTPFLLFLAPFSTLSRYAIPLVTSYMLALALCVPAVYVAARRESCSAATAAALALLFTCNHFTGSLQLADHFEVFYVLFALCAMATAKVCGWTFWIFFFLGLTVKEDAAIWLCGFALFMLCEERATAFRARFIGAAVAAGLYFIVAVSVQLWLSRIWGRGVEDYAVRVGGAGLHRDGLITFFLLLASAAFLPLFGGRAALLLLLPAPMFFAGFPFSRNLLYYYSYPFLPYLFFAAARGAAFIERRIGASGALRRAFVGAVCIAAVVQAPLPTRTDGYRRFPFPVSPRDRLRLEIARTKIPYDRPLVLQPSLFGVVPLRKDVFTFEEKNLQPHRAVFLETIGTTGMDVRHYLPPARRVVGEIESGKRRTLYSAHDFLIVAPQDAP